MVAVAVIVSLQGVASAVSPRESDFRWRGAAPPEKRIQVLAVRGPLRIEGHEGDTIEVTARRRSSEADPEVVQIAFKETAEELRIVTEYPPPPLGPPRECLWYDPVRGNFWDYFVVVELSVRAPRDRSISVHTYAGDIHASDLSGSVTVSTNDGTIRLEGVDGSIEARAEGDILLDLTQGSRRAEPILLSANGGSVELLLRPLDRLRIGSRLVVPDVTTAVEIVRAEGPFPATIGGALQESGRSLTVQVKRGSASLRAGASAPPR
jgi:hypothetical protein